MIDLPAPELQIDFSRSLKTIRRQLLQPALLTTVRNGCFRESGGEPASSGVPGPEPLTDRLCGSPS